MKFVPCLICFLPLVWPDIGSAQTQSQLDYAVRFGSIATTSPLCGLRDDRWAADLRQAEIQALGSRGASSEPGLPEARQRDRIGAAMSYAEDEALENFAAAAPIATCEPLARNPDLKLADKIVAAYRSGAGMPLW